MIRRAVVTWLILIPEAAFGAEPESPAKEPAAQAQQTIVVGQVFDYIGAGVDGATVSVTDKESGVQVGTSITEKYGDFKVTAAGGHSGIAVITIRKALFKDVSVEVRLGADDGPPFVDVQLTGAVELAGTVLDVRTAAVVRGAEILVDTGHSEWTATSAEDGTFRVEGLPPGRVTITVDAEGYARARSRIEAPDAAGRHTIRLAPERMVHLQLVDDSDQAVRGAAVECVVEDTGDYRHLVSDADGKVTVRGLSHETVELLCCLTHEAYVSSPDFDRTIVLPRDQIESTHRLVLTPAGTIAGTVVSANTREPLAGARLTVGDVLGDRLPQAWSDLDGAYRITGVPPGEAVITIHLADHAPQLTVVSVEPGGQVSIDFKMSGARVISGSVTGVDGAPVGGVHISATQWRDRSTLGLRAMTDASGRFEIIDAPADAFEIALYADGFEPLLQQVVTADRSTYEFTLKPRAQGGGTGGTATAPKRGDDAPAFSVTTLDGETVTLADLKDKVVLLDFWATWCGPCLGEIPNLIEVYDSYRKRDDFVMISISLDDDERMLRSFVAARKMPWKHAGGPRSNAVTAAERYGVTAIPALFVIGPDGKLAATDLRGPQIKSQLQRIFELQ